MTENRTVTITPEAGRVIVEMQDRVRALRDTFGPESKQHADAAASLADAYQALLSLGGTVYPDGELGLFGTSWIAYGVVFTSSGMPEEYAELGEDFLARLPEPGVWSVHS